VTERTTHLPKDQQLLVRWLHTWARDRRMSWGDLEAAVKIDSTTLSRVWNDRYRTGDGARVPLDSLCAKIARFKRVAEQRDAAAGAAFVETSVWKSIDWLCRRAFIRQKIGMIYGESQIGKTICLLEHARRNNHGQTYYVEMPPVAGVQLLLRTIARSLHVASGTCFEKLQQDVLDALDASKLLVIDEIHRVWTTYQKGSVMRCLDLLRYMHDQTRCGLVLCGTNAFRDELQHGEFAQYLKQLRRRGLYEIQLPSVPPREDLDLIAAQYELPPASGEAEEILMSVAKADGFGKVCIRLLDAAELARSRHEAVTWAHFVRVHQLIARMAAIA
jgi:DNA transposition AAA+ family ATPase